MSETSDGSFVLLLLFKLCSLLTSLKPLFSMVRRTTIGVTELNFHFKNFCNTNGNDSPWNGKEKCTRNEFFGRARSAVPFISNEENRMYGGTFENKLGLNAECRSKLCLGASGRDKLCANWKL